MKVILKKRTMKIIYRLHNNLPHNNKAVAVYEQLRHLVGVEYEPQEEREVVDTVKAIVERANSEYPRTTGYSVRTTKDVHTRHIDAIVVALDNSDKCLYLAIAEGHRRWAEIDNSKTGDDTRE